MSALAGLSGQRALVSGGTRGIGAAITRALIAAGAHVTALYRADRAAAEALAAAIDRPDQLKLRCLDVADRASVDALFADWHGPLQILVNNAGIRRDGLLGMLPPQSWDDVLAVNLGGAYALTRGAVRLMIAQRYGRIVSITSPAAAHGVAGQTSYAASKAALVAMSRSLAREVATRGITVNCVSAGLVDTELVADLSAERRQGLIDAIPIGRPAEPEEIAAAVLFVASRRASYITGATIDVTGGL